MGLCACAPHLPVRLVRCCWPGAAVRPPVSQRGGPAWAGPSPGHLPPAPPARSSCFNGGTCVDGIASFTCLCPPGFTGSYCEHDIDECDSRPCLHGGTCQDSYGTYRCTCPLGYTGLSCQVSQGLPSALARGAG